MPSTTKLLSGQGSAGDVMLDSMAPPATDWVDARVLAANTAERYTIPANCVYVQLSSPVDFYGRCGDNTVTAAIPAGDVVDGSAAVWQLGLRRVPPGITSISLISASACVVSIECWF